MTAQDQLEDRLRQASEAVMAQPFVSARLTSWVEKARAQAEILGFTSTPAELTYVAQHLSGAAFSAASTTVTDPATGGVWTLQALLMARYAPGMFGQAMGAFEIFRIVCDEEGKAVEHLSALKFGLVTTTEFDPTSVSNVWPSELSARLGQHVRTAADSVLVDNSQLTDFRLALEDALTP